MLRQAGLPGLQGPGLEAAVIALGFAVFVAVSLLLAANAGRALDELGED